MIKNLLEKVFSIKYNSKRTHKVLTITGIKIKFKINKKEKIGLLQRIFSVTNYQSKNNNWYKVVRILGVKFSLKNKNLTQRKNIEILLEKNKNIQKCIETQRKETDKIKNIQKCLENQRKEINELKLQYTSAIKRLTPQATLRSFVYHVVDHCNLKCWGCDHFAPLAKEKFASITDFENDIKRLSSLTNKELEIIKLMGGEPLLHPEIIQFMKISRKFFPNTRIEIVTNGILLNKQNEEFWNACKENNITIVPTKYPLNVDYDRAKETAKNNAVKYEYYGNRETALKTSYHIPLDIEGKQNTTENFANCFHANNCVMLKNGKIYTCTVAPNIEHFNKYFGYNIPLSERDGIDIYKVENINEILEFLAKPVPFCKYCNVKERSFGHEWGISKKDIKEWT